jgi:plasmid segregation protein ParM
MKVALDFGCADVKVAFFNDRKEIVCKSIPSLAKSEKSSVNLKGQAGYNYKVDNEDWSISSDLMNAEDTRFSSYQFSNLNRVLMHHALYTHFDDHKNFEVATGLPIYQYFVNGEVSEKNIDAKHKNVES